MLDWEKRELSCVGKYIRIIKCHDNCKLLNVSLVSMDIIMNKVTIFYSFLEQLNWCNKTSSAFSRLNMLTRLIKISQ